MLVFVDDSGDAGFKLDKGSNCQQHFFYPAYIVLIKLYTGSFF